MRIRTILVAAAFAAVSTAVPAAMAFGGDVFYFDNEDEFIAFNLADGKLMKYLETFEENNAPDDSAILLKEPLAGGIPNGPFENGLEALNFSMTSSSGKGLILLTAPFLGITSDIVGANFFADSTILHFDGLKTGIGFDLYDLINGATADITIRDNSGGVIDTINWASPFEGAFFGVWSDVIIGSIEIAGLNDGGELVDNVQMWEIPAPGSLALLGLAGLCGRRRRRS